MMYSESIIFKNLSLFFGIFFLQFIIFFPLDFLNNFQLKITHFIFGDFTQFLAENIYHKKNIRIDYSSDSCSMLILMIILLFTSAIFCAVIKKKQTEYLLSIIEYGCIMYISIILIKYGTDKIFRTQFPEPESNILFTRFGNLDKDILFWSTMGTSKIYNSIIGCIEFFTGILLLFRRYQFFGILLAMISFTQIFIINIAFDISVKFFLLILLLMSVFLVRKHEWKLFLKIIRLPKKPFFNQVVFLPYKTFLKILIPGIVLVKIAMPYLDGNFYAKDQNKLLNLKGAYSIISPESPYKYLFFHKDQYLIFMEKSSEKMSAFRYDISFDNQIILRDDQHHVSKHKFLKNIKDSTIIISFKNQIIKAKLIDSRNMNVLQDSFHILTDD